MNTPSIEVDRQFLSLAADQAKLSQQEGGVAAGAILVKGNEVVASSRDRTHQLGDPIAVAEMDCIRRAGRRSDQKELSLYSTRYPDMLVAGTVLQFSIGELVVGQPDKTSHAIDLLLSKQVSVRFVEPAERIVSGDLK